VAEPRRPREILVFEVGDRRFGLPVSGVRELLRAATIVPVPSAPAAIEGVINVRGAVVPVLDVRAWLRLPARPVEPADQLIVLDGGRRPAALRVDRVVELGELPGADAGRDGDDFAGVVKLAGGLVLMLDPAELAAAAGAGGGAGEGAP